MFLDDDRKHHEILEKVHKYDINKRREIFNQNKKLLIKLKNKRNNKDNNSMIFPAKIYQEIIEVEYQSDFGLPKIKLKNKNEIKSINCNLNKPKLYFEDQFISHEVNFNNESSYNSKKHVILEEYLKLPPGNFFFPLKDNFKKTEKIKEDEEFFFKYFGDEKLDEVNNVIEKEYIPIFSKNLNLLPNCIKSNAILIEIFKYIDKSNADNRKYYEIMKKSFPGITIKQFQDRIMMLFFRYKAKMSKEKIFKYLSCNKEEELCFDNIIGTYKEFFCSICLKYSCLLHGINQKVNYENPEAFDMMEYMNSFRNLCIDIINTNKDHEMSNEIILDSNQDFLEEMYNKKSKIESLKIKLFKNSIHFNSDKTERNNECDNNCFLSLVKGRMLGEGFNGKKELPSIIRFYFDKLFKIFKYDACNISYLINTLFKKNSVSKAIYEHKIINEKYFPIFNMMNLNKKIEQDTSLLKSEICETSSSTPSEIDNILKCNQFFFILFDKDIDSLLNSLKDDCKSIFSKQKNNKRKKKTSINKEALKIIQEKAKDNTITEYLRCAHNGNEACTKNNCECFVRGFCEKYCVCNKKLCEFYKKGCECKSDCMKLSCPCLARGTECDEDKCWGCYKDLKIKCKNKNNFDVFQIKKLAIGISEIAGWGLFALEKINKGDFISEYTGEIISVDECEKREIWNDIEKYTYMFTLTNQSIIDAKMMGNKLRFCNHSKINQNSYSKIIFSKGNFRIGIFAKKDINMYEEILFDYDGQNLLLEKYDWVDDFKKPPKDKLGGKRKREEISNEQYTLFEKKDIMIKNENKPNKMKRIIIKSKYRTKKAYAIEDGFFIEIKSEESNF